MKILAVTACPTGIAHTYMAAEAIEDAAKKMGYKVKVETRGSVGVENELTAEEIKHADAIILACDTAVPMERFAGKKVLSVPVSEALKSTDKLIERALNSKVYSTSDLSDTVASIKEQRASQRTGVYKHLMNGVSFMIPFVVAGGIAIALSFIFGYKAFEQETLQRVIEARAQVHAAREASNVGALGKAEGALRSGLGRLFAIAEAYPELKANEHFMQLQQRVSSLENGIADRRELYNETVNINNVRIEQFPDTLIARLFGFGLRPLLEFSTAEKSDVDIKGLFD